MAVAGTRAKTGANPLGSVQIVPADSIRPYKGNPRKIPEKAVRQCAESIREFGWQQPIVVDSDMVILAGHTRLKAALSLGLTRVPVIVAASLTPEQARAFRIADNRTHDYATWDFPQLIQELDGLDENFAAVLDLADWRSVIEDFERAQAAAELAMSDEASAFLRGEHALTVIFATQEDADKAGPAILELPGVINVRIARDSG